MIRINVVTPNQTVFYAAEELRKYLKMMMPDDGDFPVGFDPEAKDGFRLGLMEEFGLDTSDVKNVELDDILYIDCNENGGIIAGDNHRSVLLAVYEYLRRNGCAWLLPGVDGEYIPMKKNIPVKLRFVPSVRYRGWVSEGTEFQQSMIEAVELAPKLGMNVFMIEFKFPKSYYERYYTHVNNAYRAPEPVAYSNILQWKRQLESEIAKRGLQYHDMGHGFTYEPLGIATEDGWNTDYEKQVTPEMRELLAEINGERKIVYYPINTNLCMSNPKARKKVVDYAVDYAKRHTNVDYLHIWLADAKNNHCECPNCVTKRPTDWYTILLNEIDEAYTKEDLKTRVVFIAYMDTAWAPLEEKIKNPDRFTLMIAPIARNYAVSMSTAGDLPEPAPFIRNKLQIPSSLPEFFSLFKEWKKMWSGSNISFEYHFWRAQWRDISGLKLARCLNDDVKVYSEWGVDGILEDGSQRCFFPTGFPLYSYARSMFDMSLTYDQLAEEYFSLAFGEDWRLFYNHLSELDEAFDFEYMFGRKSKNRNVSAFYNPEQAKKLESVKDICARGRELIKSHYNSERRVGTVSVRLLEYHLEYAELLADCMRAKANGDDKLCSERFGVLVDRMSRHELAIEKYYDHCLAVNALKANFINVASKTEYMD